MVRFYTTFNNPGMNTIDPGNEFGWFEGKKVDEVYVEVAVPHSKKIPRPEMEKLIKEAEPGDIVVTKTLSNFSTSLSGIAKVVERLSAKHVMVVATYDQFDTRTLEGCAFVALLPLLKRLSDSCYISRNVREEDVKTSMYSGKHAGMRDLSDDDYRKYIDYSMILTDGRLENGCFCAEVAYTRRDPYYDDIEEEYYNDLVGYSEEECYYDLIRQ